MLKFGSSASHISLIPPLSPIPKTHTSYLCDILYKKVLNPGLLKTSTPTPRE